ncbi:hypothetical protein ABN763_13270 [Spongiivirga sp. MCCC 1A20706]|uniref:hypothetical protein n=1 Tax=Spongiivirga sp. MCCC 1A20706 TaxID=3160963 RepID=UPI0039777DC5
MQKILRIAVIVLSVLGLVLYAVLVTADDQGGIIDIMLNLVYALLIVTVIASLAFTIINIASDGKKVKKTLMSLGVFGVLAAIAYGISSGAETYNGVVTEGTSKMVGTGLYLFYFLAMIAIILMLFFGVKKVLK